MTKKEFVDMLVKKHALPRPEAEKILNAFLDSVEDALATDGNLLVRNFGAFKVVRHQARSGRNPRTGELISIPESSTIVFRASKSLTDLIN